MSDNTAFAAIWLICAIGYGIWAFKQSAPILTYRWMTFCCLLAFAGGFWLWAHNTEFQAAFGGFVVGYGYAMVRQGVKSEHLLGKRMTDYLHKESL